MTAPTRTAHLMLENNTTFHNCNEASCAQLCIKHSIGEYPFPCLRHNTLSMIRAKVNVPGTSDGL